MVVGRRKNNGRNYRAAHKPSRQRDKHFGDCYPYDDRHYNYSANVQRRVPQPRQWNAHSGKAEKTKVGMSFDTSKELYH